MIGVTLAITGTITFAVAPLAGPWAPAMVVLGAAQYGGAAKNFALGRGLSPSTANQYAQGTFLGTMGVGAFRTNKLPMTGPPSVPSSAARVWAQYEANGYQSLGAGYKVAPYKNANNLLPSGTTYKEFYVSPRPSPGTESFVMDSNGTVYYTPDHYDTFIRYK